MLYIDTENYILSQMLYLRLSKIIIYFNFMIEFILLFI